MPTPMSDNASTPPPATEPSFQCRCGYQLSDKQDCPECGFPFAEATKVAMSRLWLPALLSTVLAVLVTPMFMCTCGHIAREALVVTLPAASMAWWPFLRMRDARFIPRSFTMIAVVVSSLILLKNTADVLWFGHDALF